MVASAWKIIYDELKSIKAEGIDDANIKGRLKSDDNLRQRYLVLFDMVQNLVKVFNTRVSNLATTSRKLPFGCSLGILS